MYAGAVKLHPDNADWWNSLGQSLERSDRIQEALIAYESALKIRPENHEYWNNCGVMLALLENYSQAEKAFREALKLKPDHVIANCNLRDLQLKKSKSSRLGGVVDTTCSEFFTERELNALIERLKVAAKKSPTNLSLKIRLSQLLDRAGNLSEAVKVLKITLKYDNRNAHAWLNLAKLYMRMGEKQRAIAAFEKLIALNPGDYHGYLRLGEALKAAHHVSDALVSLRTAVELAPESAECWKAWAQILELTKDGACFAAYVRAAELSRFDADLWYAVGVLGNARGDRGTAIAALRQSLSLIHI